MTMDHSPASNTDAPMEEVLYEVKKIIVGQDILLERLVVIEALPFKCAEKV